MLLTTGKLASSFGHLLQDGSVEFQAIGLPLSSAQLIALVEQPLAVRAYHDVDVMAVFTTRGTGIYRMKGASYLVP